MLKKIIPLLVVSLVFLLDRISKIFIVEHFYLGQLVSVTSFFNLTYVENTGVAFGLGQEKNKLFVLVAGFLAILVIYWRFHSNKTASWLEKVGLDLIIAGAIGNLYDRVFYSAVIDFLDFYVGQWHWPAFNIADSAICVGACLLVFSQYRLTSR